MILLSSILHITKGWGNYKNYKNNKKVINLAKKVEKQSNIYKQQLLECKNSLSDNKIYYFLI